MIVYRLCNELEYKKIIDKVIISIDFEDYLNMDYEDKIENVYDIINKDKKYIKRI